MDYIYMLLSQYYTKPDVVLYVDKAAALDGKRGHGALLRLCRLLFPLPQALQAKRPHLTAKNAWPSVSDPVPF
jgi:hypothetical protein